MQLDDHGQPVDLFVQERLRVDRSIHEMLGLIKGVLIDGVVSDREALALNAWFLANPDALRVWPGKVLAARLRKILADGTVDEDERQDLSELLQATVGTPEMPDVNPTTALPLDEPPPPLLFTGRAYLFTGKFVYGTRNDCQQAVLDRGGKCVTRVVQDMNVLVVGCDGSRDWIHTSFGRKIEGVVRLKQRGLPIAIVGEQHWALQLQT